MDRNGFLHITHLYTILDDSGKDILETEKADFPLYYWNLGRFIKNRGVSKLINASRRRYIQIKILLLSTLSLRYSQVQKLLFHRKSLKDWSFDRQRTFTSENNYNKNLTIEQAFYILTDNMNKNKNKLV